MILTHLQRSFRLFRIYDGDLELCHCKFSANIDLLNFADGRVQNDHLIMLDVWINHIVENSVAYNVWDDLDFSTLHALKNNVIQIPGDPDDYLLANVFFGKMQSILGETVTIQDIQFSTDSGPGIAFTISAESLDLPSITDWVGEKHYWDQPWWGRSDGSTLDVIPSEDDNLLEKPDILIDLHEFLPTRTPITNPAEIIKPNFHLKVINNDTP